MCIILTELKKKKAGLMLERTEERPVLKGRDMR